MPFEVQCRAKLLSYLTRPKNPTLRRNLPFDHVKDFAPVMGIAQSSDVLIAGNALAANNVRELVALSRARPCTLNYGSFGVGTATHLDAIALAAAAGIQITHIPYKGGADVIAAVLGGQVDFAFTGLNAVIPLVKQEMNLQGAALAERVKESRESFASRVKGLDIKLD